MMPCCDAAPISTRSICRAARRRASFRPTGWRRALATTGEAGGDVAVDVDQRLQLRGMRIHLHLDGLLQHEDADIGDVLTDFQRVRILVGFGFGQEDRPQPAIEHQRVVQVAVRALPVGLDLLQLPCRLEQRLRLYFPGRCRRLRGASIGLSGMRHSEHPDLTKRMRTLAEVPNLCTWLPLKYG